jgi:hypothetical protein
MLKKGNEFTLMEGRTVVKYFRGERLFRALADISQLIENDVADLNCCVLSRRKTLDKMISTEKSL